MSKYEKLDSKWIDEHAQGGCDEWVYTEDLENLLVPKQDKPVIPKFVADYLCRAKEDITLMRVMELANTRNELPKWEKQYGWISENDETFARAWLDGYKVEKEKKYYVLDSEDIPLLERANNQTYKTTTTLSIHEDGRDNSKFELTEQEIKEYDKRFWAFAQEVTE